MSHHNSWIVGSVATAIVLLGISVAVASSVSIPNDFVSGTPAVASEVNQNFSAVEAAINDNDSRVTAIEANGIARVALHVDGVTAVVSVTRFFTNVSGAPTPTVSRVGVGTYQVNVGTPAAAAFWTAALGVSAVGSEAAGSISVQPSTTQANSLFVKTFDAAGADANREFYIVVY